MPTDYRREMLTWTADELRTFLLCSESETISPLWRLAAQTGMRRGELLGLRWSDVNLEAGRISIRQQWFRPGTRSLSVNRRPRLVAAISTSTR